MNENVALNKKHQSKFARKVQKAKERMQTASPSNNTNNYVNVGTKKTKSGVIYVGHIPHGFYEKEMLAYFKQFGRVTNLRLCRSNKTGRSKGYAFVEFASAAVAKIAADTMDNYLMFNRRLVAQFVPAGKLKKRPYKGKSWSESFYPLKTIREKVTKQKNKNVDEVTHIKKCKKMITTINKTLQKLHEVGINYSFQPSDDSFGLSTYILRPPNNDVEKKSAPEILKKHKSLEKKTKIAQKKKGTKL